VDVFHSGTVAVAAFAASVFGVASIAFSQQLSPFVEGNEEASNKRELFRTAEQFTRKVLETHDMAPGSCLNVNFPIDSPKGYKKVSPASYSRWRPAGIPSPDSLNDIQAVEDGYIAISYLELSIRPAMTY
jgi:broad specificity polyphosphatase/5'/3'-nucleotidase SurE